MDWNEAKNLNSGWDSSIIGDKVVGVTFAAGYPHNLIQLKSQLEKNGPLKAVLHRSPENQYDKNACEVWVDGKMIGHLSKELAATVAPRLDLDANYEMNITSIGFANEDPTKPGAGFQLRFTL